MKEMVKEMLDGSDVVTLARKLVTTLHLGISERQQLPNGRVPWSAILAVVEKELSESGWFPSELSGPELVGEGAVIQLSKGVFVVHSRHETGVGRFGDVKTATAPHLDEAVRLYVDEACGGVSGHVEEIAGIRIEWDE